MRIALRFLSVAFIFLLFATFPDNLSRSATPHHNERFTHQEETRFYQYLVRDKIEKIDAALNRYNWFNGNVMVVKNHKVIYESARGYANYRTRQPLTTESVFELASVSKQFTAIAILMLCDRNLIDVDDPVSLYIPELPYQGVTIRQLLNHTSGLPNYFWVLENYWSNDHLPSNEDMLKMLTKHKPHPFFRAGRRFSYSNTGYALLASVVERVTGESFTHFLRKNIFEPLEMHNTFTRAEILDSTFHHPDIAQGHHHAWRRLRLNTTVVHDNVLGDKGIHSNLTDLYKWDQALYSGILVSNSLLEQAYQPLVLPNRRSHPYGFGFRTASKNGSNYVYHHGLWEGFRTSFVRYLENGDAIIILNNTNQQVNNQMIRQIRDILDEPSEPTPTQAIILELIRNGWIHANEIHQEMTRMDKSFSPDPDELLEAAWLLREMNKPMLSSLLYQFYEEAFSEKYAGEAVTYID